MIKEHLSKLGKGALVYGLGGLINRFLSFLLLPLFTSYLKPADYGVTSLLGLMSLVLTPLFSMGISASIAPFFFDKSIEDAKSKAIWTAFVILLTSVFLLTIVGEIFAPKLSLLAFQTERYHYVVSLTLLSIALSVINLPLLQYLQFEQRAKLFVSLTTISMLVTIALNIVFVVVLRRGVKGLIESQLVGQVISVLLFLPPVLFSLRFRIDYEVGKKLLKLSIPLIPSFGFFFVLQDGNKYILQWLKGLDVVGIYAIGFNFGMALKLASSAFDQAWLPFFMSFVDKADEARIVLGRVATYYIIGFGILSLMFYAVAKPVVMIMTQPAFHQAYIVIGLSATATLLTGMYMLQLPSIYYAKEVQFVTLIQAISAGLAVAFNILLVKFVGLLGAGLGLVFSMVVLNVVIFIWNKQRLGYVRICYEWKRLLLFGSGYLVCVLLLLIPRSFSLLKEIFLSVGTIILILPLAYFQLTKSEQRILRSKAALTLPGFSKASIS